MRDAVENLAKAYIEIRKEGCIQSTVGIEIKLQSINQVIQGLRKESKGSSLEFCRDLYTYLNSCVSKWRENMDKYRRLVSVCQYDTVTLNRDNNLKCNY